MIKSLKKFFRLEGKKFNEIPSIKPLKKTEKEITEMLQKEKLQNWKYDLSKNCISKKIQFDNFYESMCFMNSVAIFAEKIQHHPEWFNVYNRINIDLRTHDCDGVSFKDFYLSRYIDLIEDIVRSQKPDNFQKVFSVDEQTFLKD
jgi:4a-hydroxytetrahydrobiopterin dehydratase